MIPEISLFFILVLIVFSVFVIIATNKLRDERVNAQQQKRKYLKGPMCVPFWGSGIQVAAVASIKNFNDTFNELCSKYGGICGLYGSRANYFVFVNDAEIATRMLKDENFEGKFPQPSWDSLIYGKPNMGILHSFGTTTKELRSRSIAKLRKYGYGKGNFSNLLQSLVNDCLATFELEREKNAGVVVIDKYTFISEMSDMLWNVLIGSAFPGEKYEFLEIINAAEISLNTNVKQFVILYAYKYLRFIPGLTMYQNTKDFFAKIEKIIRKVIEERRASGAYKLNQNSFIDDFLMDVDANVHPDVTDEQLVYVILDLQLVGVTGLPSNSLHWSLLYVILHPAVLRKLVREIDDVIGQSRAPSADDRSRMPYSESVILESIRMGNVVNYAMRTNLENTTFDGYFIPKETLVMVDTECLRKNPRIWSDPNVFRPERFYDEETNSLVNVEKINAFGFKRPCMGETIIKQCNFVFLSSILQKYTVELCPNYAIPTIKPTSGIVSRPEPFHIKLTPRSFTSN